MEDLRAYCLGGGQAVGVFFSLSFCAFFLSDKERGFARRFFMENLMVIVNMFVA